MIDRFEQGSSAQGPTLLLLHGTGGTETDLLELGRSLAPDASLLGVRGQELERGMTRFFKRLEEGVFDQENLIYRTNELHEYIDEAAELYGFDRSNVWAVGYSNGANIAGSLLFHHQGSLKGAILFHPMVPRRGIDLPDLTGVPVFIGAGSNDPLCSPTETRELASLLQHSGANVELFWGHEGHRVTSDEITVAIDWLTGHLDTES
ncbi:MAG: alpha/beta hydrolase [Gorillibacterium sp.]|nr:alpha/beta hydrolase [Gorillibacterium sp.]